MAEVTKKYKMMQHSQAVTGINRCKNNRKIMYNSLCFILHSGCTVDERTT